MGIRYRKSVKIVPGVKLNIGKQSVGIGIGGKYGGISYNTKTGARARVSAPGTGLSYTTKVGNSKRSTTKAKPPQPDNAISNDSIKVQKPLIAKWWYVLITLMLLIGGFGNIGSNAGAAVFGIGLGAFLVFAGISSYKKYKNNPLKDLDIESFNRYLQIFDESFKIVAETIEPETFFVSYNEALNAAESMAAMTNQPIVHGDTPQNAVQALKDRQTELTNAFLDRYAKDIRMKAFELTRGRKGKLETFMLITSEYDDAMTSDSKAYRDKLYADMFEKIEEEKTVSI